MSKDKPQQAEDPKRLYRRLPQLGDAVDELERAGGLARYPRALGTEAARAALARLRSRIGAGACTEAELEASLGALGETVGEALRSQLRPSLRRVINATGVILQTNLGRAPLSEAAIRNIAEVARGYANLEIDLETGERSRRDAHVEQRILDLAALRKGLPVESFSATRAAAVVNNCAAATLLALNSLAEGGEVIVSRGELVEIGGGFRVPDILRKSGARLCEVGTTNRTRIADYAAAITPATRLILRVHRSNFRIEGFTEQPIIAELVELGAKSNIPVFEDQGTGCVIELENYGMGESSWVDSVSSGVTLVAASGDKLLGGPQCGLLVGTHEAIKLIRANPLYRALRVDKLTYAALEATLLAYLGGKEGDIPAVAMLQLPLQDIEQRCRCLAQTLRRDKLSAEVTPARSLVGGGTTPGATLASFAVALRHAEMSEGALAALLRKLEVPILARTSEGRVLLDLRTVSAEDDLTVVRTLQQALHGPGAGAGK